MRYEITSFDELTQFVRTSLLLDFFVKNSWEKT